MSNNVCTDLSFTQDCIDPFDPENPNLWVKLEHLGRYLFAADYLRRYRPQILADIACGVGYGLPELTQIGDTVIAVDQDSALLETAYQNWHKDARLGHGEMRCQQHNLESLPWPSVLGHSTLDAIVSFETLEHLLEPERTLAQFALALKDKGFLICSVPNSLYDPADASGLPVNPYHKHFFSFSTFRRLLEQQGFQVVYRLGQASSNLLFKRESQLLKRRSIHHRLGDFAAMHTLDILRHLTYLLAYPTVEDVDGSYSLIVVAQKS